MTGRGFKETRAALAKAMSQKKPKIMNNAPYIPARDAEFIAWLLNFSGVVGGAPVTYGLTIADGGVIENTYSDMFNSYNLATNPPTRTAATVAAKDAQRVASEQIIRGYAMRIQANSGISNEQLVAAGLTVKIFPATPIPAPVTSPALILVSGAPNVHNMQYRDSTDPTRKAKPFGVKQLTLFRTIGLAPAVEPEAARYVGGFTKTPLQVSTSAADKGKVATYFARWENGAGPGGVAAVGPWSEPFPVICM